MPSFISLLPLEYQATANALIADLKATKKIEQIKEREKKPHGESSEQSRSAVSQKGFGESKQPRKEGINTLFSYFYETKILHTIMLNLREMGRDL